MKKNQLKHAAQFGRAIGLSGGLIMAMSSSVMAQEGGGNRISSLEEIVVTAQFREQSMQDTPIAITAINSDMIDRRGYESVIDVASAAPNVTLKEGFGIYSGVIGYIRGIGQFDSQIALEAGVGVYLDDVYLANSSGSNLGLLDLDRIEILRGPQGTLAGANSVGGAVKMYTKKPTGDGDGYFEAGFGSNDTYVARGAFDSTLIEDKLFMRVSGGHRSAGGYVDMIDYVCEHPGSSGNLIRTTAQGDDCKTGEAGGTSSTSARVALRWLPSDDLEVNLSLDKSSSDSDAAPFVLTALSDQPGLHFYNDQTQAIHGISYDERFIPEKGSYKTYATYNDPDRAGRAFDPNGYADAAGLHLNLEYQLNDNLTLTSITSYRESDVYGSNDTDASPLGLASEQYFWDVETITQEIRLSGDTDNLDWTLGAYYMKSDQNLTGFVNAQSARIPPFVLPPPLHAIYPYGVDILFFQVDDEAEREKMAVFANGSYSLTDTLGLTVGLRYSDTSFNYDQGRFDPMGQDPLNPGVLKPQLFLAHLGVAPEQGSERLDYRVALDFQASDSTMVYGQIASGFKDGGINPTATSPETQTTFDEEDLVSYELGIKGDYLDGTLRANAALFYSDYTELQIRTVLSDGTAPTSNAGEASIAGIEVETEWVPTDGMLITASASYIDFEYGDLGNAGPDFVANGPCNDCTNLYTPEVTAFFAIQHTFDKGNGGSWTPRISAEYQDKLYTDINNLEDSAIEDRWIANARLTWESVDTDWKVSMAVNNLFDEYYFHQVRTGLNNLGMAVGAVGRPREVMLTARKSF